jgi:hypothetical protein
VAAPSPVESGTTDPDGTESTRVVRGSRAAPLEAAPAGAAAFGFAGAFAAVAGLAAGFALVAVRAPVAALGLAVGRFAGDLVDDVLVVGSSSDGLSAIGGFLRFGRIA